MHALKSFFQPYQTFKPLAFKFRDYVKAYPEEIIASQLYPYSYNDNLLLASQKIRSKSSVTSLSFANIFTCIPINNWERELESAFNACGLNHFSIPISGSTFFNFAREWKRYKSENSYILFRASIKIIIQTGLILFSFIYQIFILIVLYLKLFLNLRTQ